MYLKQLMIIHAKFYEIAKTRLISQKKLYLS